MLWDQNVGKDETTQLLWRWGLKITDNVANDVIMSMTLWFIVWMVAKETSDKTILNPIELAYLMDWICFIQPTNLQNKFQQEYRYAYNAFFFSSGLHLQWLLISYFGTVSVWSNVFDHDR